MVQFASRRRPQALGAVVFSDSTRLRELNAIVWPHTRARLVAELQRLASAAPMPALIFVEAVGLREAGWADLTDEVWEVSAPEASVLRRLAEQRGMSRAWRASVLTLQRSRRGSAWRRRARLAPRVRTSCW